MRVFPLNERTMSHGAMLKSVELFKIKKNIFRKSGINEL